MGKITIEVKINTFGNMLYSLNHPSVRNSTYYYIMNKSYIDHTFIDIQLHSYFTIIL